MRYVTLLVGIAFAVVVLSGLTWDRDAGTLEYKEATAQTLTFMPPLRGAPSSRIGGGTRGPAYRAPLRGAPASRIGGGTRGPEVAWYTVAVLTPEEALGLTVREQPDLYWYLSHDTDLPVEVNLIDETSPIDKATSQPLFEVRFTGLKAGVHRLRLADYYKARLVPGRTYRWSVALIFDETSRSQDVVSSAWIERISPEADLQQQLAQASQKDIPRIYAVAGIWYDALAALSALIEAAPRDKALRQQRISLLKDKTVNLPEVAAYDEQQQKKMDKSS